MSEDEDNPAATRRASTERAILRFYKGQIPKKRGKRLDVPYEWEEARDFVSWMRAKGIVHAHVPNEGKRSGQRGKAMVEGGLQKGFPDFIIIGPRPPCGAPGIVIELKRRKYYNHPPEQKAWLATFKDWGWFSSFAHGADEAIDLVAGWLGIPR